MNTTPQFSRRTIARGIAWSTPVVVASAIAPAYARSIPAPTVEIIACKSPGNSNPDFPKGYNVYFDIDNNADEIVTINDIQIDVTGTDLQFIWDESAILIPKDGSTQIVVSANSRNSADLTFDLDITVSWTGETGDNGKITRTLSVEGTPPHCSGTGDNATSSPTPTAEPTAEETTAAEEPPVTEEPVVNEETNLPAEEATASVEETTAVEQSAAPEETAATEDAKVTEQN